MQEVEFFLLINALYLT